MFINSSVICTSFYVIMLRDTVDGQFTTVEDVANTLAFLANDQGALTGQSLRLTHGWAMM